MWLIFLHGPPGVGKLTVGGKRNSVDSYRVLRADGAFDVPLLPADLVIDIGSRSAREAAQEVVEQLQVSGSVDTHL